MNLRRIIGLGMMLFGVALLVLGVRATDKFGEKVVEEFTGHYTNETTKYILGGVALILVGAAISWIRRK